MSKTTNTRGNGDSYNAALARAQRRPAYRNGGDSDLMKHLKFFLTLTPVLFAVLGSWWSNDRRLDTVEQSLVEIKTDVRYLKEGSEKREERMLSALEAIISDG